MLSPTPGNFDEYIDEIEKLSKQDATSDFT